MNIILLVIILIIILFLMFLINKSTLNEKFNNDTNKFKNVILLVVFNYADCVHNLNKIKNLYKNHFKDVIFYSDTPEDSENSEVNYLPIDKGYYTQRTFKHFYDKYRDLINDSDGVMYTMDDNIINVNELDNYSPNKIICFYDEKIYYKPHDEVDNDTQHWGHWHGNKDGMENLLKEKENEKFKIEKFTWGFADWFYLPKKYINDNTFDLFDLFARMNIFLEIAIPTVIRYLNEDRSDFQDVKFLCLWGGDRSNFENKDFVYKSLKDDKNLIIHPIKFNSNPDALIWLDDIFNN
jgi:hypothetical protein